MLHCVRIASFLVFFILNVFLLNELPDLVGIFHEETLRFDDIKELLLLRIRVLIEAMGRFYGDLLLLIFHHPALDDSFPVELQLFIHEFQDRLLLSVTALLELGTYNLKGVN
mmetsp:Transcript_14188/g.13761  ORF Transcript_14188/g.13761 Transcript_14188/m.13761 type:complete len:112 (-) Transcript_14188:180-515(-)